MAKNKSEKNAKNGQSEGGVAVAEQPEVHAQTENVEGQTEGSETPAEAKARKERSESINYRVTPELFNSMYNKAETFKQFHEMFDKIVVKLGAVDTEGKPLTGIERNALKGKLDYFLGKLKENNEARVKAGLTPFTIKTFPDMSVRPKVSWDDVFGEGEAQTKAMAELDALLA